MIKTLDEAKKHANHTDILRYKFVVVLEDESVYVSNDQVEMEKLMTENKNNFVVKGDLKQIVVAKTNKKETE